MTTQTCDKTQPNPRRGRHNADSEAAAERAEEAHRLYLCRFTIRQIAGKLGVSKTAVHNYLKAGRERFLASIQASQAERHANRHAELDAILDAAWTHYRDTADLAALELVRKCQADLRKLYGDDAPAKSQTELSGKVDGGVTFLPKEQMYAAVMESIAKLERKPAGL
ncbi:MAG: hypothetical protein IAF94_07655 [Pirellulaceae bacterium]|nr:hypothetical protein [Pirellulaceae bacterium]